MSWDAKKTDFCLHTNKFGTYCLHAHNNSNVCSLVRGADVTETDRGITPYLRRTEF
jgi:hypothetical protein